MKLINTSGKLALVVSVLLLAACSSSDQHGVSDGGLLESSTGISTGGGNSSYDQQALQDQQTLQQLQNLEQNNTLYFGLDKYDIQSDYSNMLDEHAAFLRDHQNIRVTIEGHTDERGTPEYNISLGERRANAVKMYLQGRGVPASQISIISYGKERPAVLGYSEVAFAKNRRAVLVY